MSPRRSWPQPVALLLGILSLGALALGLPPHAAAQAADPELSGGRPVFGSFTKVYRKAEGAVVSIRATRGATTSVGDQFRQIGASESVPDVAVGLVKLSLSIPVYLAQSAVKFALDPLGDDAGDEGIGSGFIIDPEGLVITNHHVVEGADRIEVRWADDQFERARLVASDPDLDVALLALDRGRRSTFPAVSLGASDRLEPGQWVMAVGSPYGLERTVSVGVVSAPSRRLGGGPFDEYIQIDAAVNPGSSGGPLFDGDGNVVGVNTATIADGAGIGFSIPIQAVSAALPALRAGRTPARFPFGVEVETATPDEFEGIELDRDPGLWVRSVEPGSAAERAGIREGDLLIALAKHRLRRPADLALAERDLVAGTAVRAHVWRDGEFQTLTVAPAGATGDT